jgi:predicted AlkP superfamily phosphohydrolase/phosphomutase
MSRSDRPRVLAVGIDAAEPSLLRGMIDRGQLPALRALRDRGAWGRVRSPADIGSGAVWPTFTSGASPSSHGVYGDWVWRPDAMRVSRVTWDHLRPFWGALSDQGRSVTVIDIPFAPVSGRPHCVEVADWGAHDILGGHLEVSPPALERLVREAGGVHPFAAETVDTTGPDDLEGMARVGARCVAGAQQRGRLAAQLAAVTKPDVLLVVFTEVHRASHLLWHTVDPTHPVHRTVGLDGAPSGAGALHDVVQEVDRQIARLVETVGPDATVLVFSLHGMRPTRGIPTLLEPLLRGLGASVVKPRRDRSTAELAAEALGAVKRRIPGRLKDVYYRLLSRRVTSRLAQPPMAMPAYDWSRTTAVSLPTDQHGWIRLNLAGREADGLVDPREYENACARLERELRAVTTEDGQPVVRDVLRLASRFGGSPPRDLPDLVVHWHDVTFASPIRIGAPPVSAYPIGMKFTGQHAPDGFFILRPGPAGPPAPTDPVAAEDLHRLL